MEHVDSSYAKLLHDMPFNPYSQYCWAEKPDGKLLWRINALSNEAAEQLLAKMADVTAVDLKTPGLGFQVVRSTMDSIPLLSLTDDIQKDPGPRFSLRFVTPTAFKSKGEYVIIPSARLVIQNLLMHYSYVFSGSAETDAETLDYLDQHIRISSYRLRSHYFGNVMKGGGKIPAFEGDMVLSISGPQMAQGLVWMLLRFAEYAGVGIKTSMGMGAVSCSKLPIKGVEESHD